MGPGDRLGQYEIVSGGASDDSGEVWAGRDTARGVDVTLTRVSEEVAGSESARTALANETRTLAGIDHPNLARVRGLEEADGSLFLVTEKPEGETLAARLRAGAIPVAGALGIAHQIAAGLEAAHKQGVVHRNVNPSSIRILPDGQLKILDFGRVSTLQLNSSDLDLSTSPTMSGTISHSGTLPGTAGYQAPEQARGEPAGRAADIWALGCVLFEMLTGHAAFRGRTDADALALVLRTEPDWDRLPGGLDPRVRDLLERCLAKNPTQRASDAAEVAADIARAQAEPAAAAVAGPSLWLGWVAVLVGAAALAALAGWSLSANTPSTLVRLEMDRAEAGPVYPWILNPELAIAPDGSRAVYLQNGRGGYMVRDRADMTPRPVQIATEESLWFRSVVFSPDGAYLYFVEQPNPLGGRGRGGGGPVARSFAVQRVSVDGGSPTPVFTAWPDPVFDLTLDDDQLLMVDDSSILTVPLTGGTPEPLLAAGFASFPQRLPGGDHVLYTLGPATLMAAIYGAGETSRIIVASIVDPEDRREILTDAIEARYVPDTGDLVYRGTRNRGLWAVAFDLNRLEPSGDPVQLIEGPVVDFAISVSGDLVYALAPGLPEPRAFAPGEFAAPTRLALLDRNLENVEELRMDPGVYSHPRVSPDGTRVAYAFVDDLGEHIAVYDFRTRERQTLPDEGDNSHPIWKDDQTVTFASNREGRWAVYSRDLDSGETTLVVDAPQGRAFYPGAWSPDDILVMTQVPESGFRWEGSLWMVSAGSDPEELDPYRPGNAEFDPTLSPDGTVLVYMADCDEDGYCIRARRFPPVRGSSIPVDVGSDWAALSPDGTELIRMRRGILATYDVDVDSLDFVATDMESSELRPPRVTLVRPWDLVGPDADQLVMVIDAGSEPVAEEPPAETISVSSEIHYVHNFLEVLRESVR